MEQPEGFVVAAGKVCRLRKAIYGLKQAGRQWFLALAACLEKIGFVCRDTGDVCVFIRRPTRGDVEILVVYVDDLTMMGNSLELINQTKEALKGSFKLKDLGELKLYLGIRVTRDRGSKRIYLDQEVYIEQVLERFGFHVMSETWVSSRILSLRGSVEFGALGSRTLSPHGLFPLSYQ